MFDNELNVAVFNYAYFMVCLSVMGVGVMVVRCAADVDSLFVHIRRTLPLALVVVFGCLVCAKLKVPVGCLYIFGLYASFCIGIVLDIAESDPDRFKQAAGDFARESARQMGKLPTSH